jgi:hypothetical protein
VEDQDDKMPVNDWNSEEWVNPDPLSPARGMLFAWCVTVIMIVSSIGVMWVLDHVGLPG